MYQINSLRKDPRNVSLVTSPTTNTDGGIDGDGDGNNRNTSTSVKKSIIDPYGDRGYYRGELLLPSTTSTSTLNHRSNNNDVKNDDDNIDYGTDIPHGLGTMEYSDGRIYVGKWNNGQWNDDNGRATYPNGDIYNGNFYEDQRHGQGKYVFLDGRIYQGGFSNDQRCGHGTYSWPDNSIYEGEFYNGLRHGKGTYTVRVQLIIKNIYANR
jgi:hypothetical protein